MLMVLAHHNGWSKASIGLPFIFLPQPSTLYYLFIIALFLVSGPQVSGQTLLNGQLFTGGLSIVDAPAPQSTYHFGSDLSIAIDVSGNGKLPPSASVPGNIGTNGYDGLDIYLVSSQTNTNMTVSNNSDILKQQQGSTVKHLNWDIPSCVSSGEYNLTLYECARINGQFYYTITSIPIEIDNLYPSGPCTSGANPLQDQPQAQSPPPQSPFLPTDPGQTNARTSSGFTTMVYSSSAPGTITFTMSSGAQMPSYSPYEHTSVSNGQTATVTESATPTTVTVVVISTEILTNMGSGTTSAYTTTQTSTSTTTAIINGPSGSSGFLPVNAGSSDHSITFSWLLGLFIVATFVTSCDTCNI